MDEIGKLLDEVFFSCSLKSEGIEDMFVSVPSPGVYNAESEGYKFCIKKTLVNESSLNCLKAIVEKRKLKMTESKKYLVIYAPRKA
jgi:hypothetical protein